MASKNSERDSEISRRIDELIRSVANIQTSTQAHKHTLSQAHRRRSRLIHIRQLGWERWRVIESQLKTAASESSESSNRSQMSFPRSSAHLSGYQKSASRVSFGPYSPLERYSRAFFTSLSPAGQAGPTRAKPGQIGPRRAKPGQPGRINTGEKPTRTQIRNKWKKKELTRQERERTSMRETSRRRNVRLHTSEGNRVALTAQGFGSDADCVAHSNRAVAIMTVGQGNRWRRSRNKIG